MWPRNLQVKDQRFYKMLAQSSQNVGKNGIKTYGMISRRSLEASKSVNSLPSRPERTAFPDDDFTELSVAVLWDSASPLWLHSDLHPTPEWPPEDTQQFGEALSVVSLITTPETRQQVHPLSLAAAALFPLHRYAASYSVPPPPFSPLTPLKVPIFFFDWCVVAKSWQIKVLPHFAAPAD